MKALVCQAVFDSARTQDYVFGCIFVLVQNCTQEKPSKEGFYLCDFEILRLLHFTSAIEYNVLISKERIMYK